MSKRKIILAAIVIAGGIPVLAAFSLNHASAKKAPATVPGFAVVELFTSEGCSSCPPADALVSKIQQENTGNPVYILTYHVDYWNRLGWRDPFSNAAYSQRQRNYASLMHNSSVYTPQIVVNGLKEFVGSEEGTLRNAIKSAEKTSDNIQLQLMDVVTEGNRINYKYHTNNTATNIVLTVALLQKTAKTDVKAGENSGRTLSHVQIVRGLQIIPLNSKAEGTGTLSIPKDASYNLELTAFLQNQTTGQILAATSYGPTTRG